MSKKVILCVDDELIILNSLKTQIKEKFGKTFHLETAENATDAMSLIDELFSEKCKILIIVSDWLMPGIKGDEFLINVHKKYPEIVTIMLTGQACEEAVAKARAEANLHRCIFKPWTETELYESISTGLEKLN